MPSVRRTCRLAAFTLAALATVGCDNPTGRAKIHVRAQLIRLPGRSSSGLSAAIAPGNGSGTNAVPIPWTTLVNVVSVRSPIADISLVRVGGGRGSHVSLYNCPAATASGCLVELNGPELQNLLGTSPVAVEVGTYDAVAVGSCVGSSAMSARVFVTASAVIGGATYYTRTIGTLGTTGPAEPVSIDYTGCSVTYPISPPLVISDALTATTDVRLYFDMFDVASAVLPSPQANNIFVGGPCTPRPTQSTPFVCLSYPNPVAVVGTTPPVIEHYRINNGATLGLVFDASTDLFYGGYFRRYFVEDQPWNPGFGPDPPVGTFTSIGGGAYRMVLVTSSSGVPGAVFPAWRRDPVHSGTITFAGGMTAAYTAVRLP